MKPTPPEPPKERKWWQKAGDWVSDKLSDGRKWIVDNVQEIKSWIDPIVAIYSEPLQLLKSIGTKAGKLVANFGKGLGVIGGGIGVIAALIDWRKHGFDKFVLADLSIGLASIVLTFVSLTPVGLAAVVVGGILYGITRQFWKR